MRFDKTVEVLGEQRVSNGMGGWTVTHGVVRDFDAIVTPVKAEIMLKENGIVSTTSMKIYTRDSLEEFLKNGTWDKEYQLQYNGSQYTILQYADFTKVRMLLVEVVN